MDCENDLGGLSVAHIFNASCLHFKKKFNDLGFDLQQIMRACVRLQIVSWVLPRTAAHLIDNLFKILEESFLKITDIEDANKH
jgi:hypothetical protein